MEEVKLRAGNYRVPCRVEIKDGRYWFHFRYNAELLKEIKKLQGRSYHGFDSTNPRKIWSAPVNSRNIFNLDYLSSNDSFGPYKQWKTEVPKVVFPQFNGKDLWVHQKEDAEAWLHRKVMIWANEMRTGKTLGAFAAIRELLLRYDINQEDIWWVGTKSSLGSTESELRYWKPGFTPRQLTYDRIRIMVEKGEIDRIPQILVLDEFHKVKSHTAARSQAVFQLAEWMREAPDNICYILALGGTPNPRGPTDWWMPCEIVRPGYLAEGSAGDLQRRVSLIEMAESPAGGVFPKVITLLNNEDICCFTWKEDTGLTDDAGKQIIKDRVCGKIKGDACHDLDFFSEDKPHTFVKSINEVLKLDKRLAGLVTKRFKRDCLSLPPMRPTEFCILRPSFETLQLAKLIIQTAPRAITALTLLRELSDGFQYREVEVDTKYLCPECKGTKQLTGIEDTCDLCDADGMVAEYVRQADYLGGPKEEEFKADLERHEDCGRLVAYAAFSGTIDRLVDIACKENWYVFKVDGRGHKMFNPKGEVVPGLRLPDFIDMFMRKREGPERCIWIGHPQSGGEGCDLATSPTLLWVSEPFKADAFTQASARIYGPNMDVNRGAGLKIYIHLPSDKYIHDSNESKRRLELMTMGELRGDLNDLLR